MTRDQALAIVREHVKNENLVKHMLAVEAAMRAYAIKFGEDQDFWGNAGLLHDFDWEIHPSLEEHPQKGADILRHRGVGEEMISTILAHAPHTGEPRDTLVKKTLFACDELTGLITAAALVKPDKKLESVEVSSIKKKFKDKAFARNVNREEIKQGADELGVELWDHVQFVLDAMKKISHQLGL